jgi:hypothetical protein
MTSKIVHVLYLNNYMPKLCALTLPTLEGYAKKIGADFNLITKRAFKEWPITYEKMQVYKDGINADWNILLDADLIMHPDMPDITTFMNPTVIGCYTSFVRSIHFPENIYFKRHGGIVGIATNFVVTSRMTHDFWTPFKEKASDIVPTLRNPHQTDEYCVSTNLARYNLKYTGVTFPETIGKFYNLDVTTDTHGEEYGVEMAKRYMKANQML